MKQCPFCAELIQDEAVFCRYCRRDLPHESKLKCPYCNNLGKAGTTFCVNCGRYIGQDAELLPESLDQSRDLAETESTLKQEKNERLRTVIFVILMIIAGTLFFGDMISVETAGRMGNNPLLVVGGLMAWLGRKSWVRNLGWFLLLASTCSLLLNDPFLTR